MRRGGLLILLVGLILIVGAVGLYMFLQLPSPGSVNDPSATVLPTSAPPQVEIVRALVDIPANTVITDRQLLEIVNIDQTEFDTQQNFTNDSEIMGKLTLRTFRAGEPIKKAALIEPGLSQQIPTAEPNRASDKAYPFVVNNLSGVADQVKPGDFVDVVATFEVKRPVSTIGQAPPTAPGTAPVGAPNALADQTLRSTKTIIQRAQVLRIVRPPVDLMPTPATGGASGTAPSTGNTPPVDGTGQPIQPTTADGSVVTQGSWTLVLAINDQEAELMEFAIAADARLVLVLRGAGDTAFEPTIGTTFDLLIDQFGLPLPYPLHPYVVGINEQLTPQPTRTPMPTPVP